MNGKLEKPGRGGGQTRSNRVAGSTTNGLDERRKRATTVSPHASVGKRQGRIPNVRKAHEKAIRIGRREGHAQQTLLFVIGDEAAKIQERRRLNDAVDEGERQPIPLQHDECVGNGGIRNDRQRALEAGGHELGTKLRETRSGNQRENRRDDNGGGKGDDVVHGGARDRRGDRPTGHQHSKGRQRSRLPVKRRRTRHRMHDRH